MTWRVPKSLTDDGVQSRPERSVLQHVPLVRVLARKIHDRLPANVEMNDLFSAGTVGLLEAAAKFEPSMSVKFECYAHLRIRGAILDSLRDIDWAPRDLRRKGRAFAEATQALTMKLGRSPSSEEMAAALKISLSAYHTTLGDLNGLEIITLDSKHEGDNFDSQGIDAPARPEDDPLSQRIERQRQERLSMAIIGLAWRERLVVRLYYYDEMTMWEIGRILGVVESRVSHIHASAIENLRAVLSDLSLRGGERAASPRRKTNKKISNMKSKDPQVNATTALTRVRKRMAFQADRMSAGGSGTSNVPNG